MIGILLHRGFLQAADRLVKQALANIRPGLAGGLATEEALVTGATIVIDAIVTDAPGWF
ncbi:MAG: hypothetical protein WA417_24075 [Stellaceae bacterium]|jgi:hypothetical protein